MGLRVLVTGASGFVGQAFCSEWAARGGEVVAALRTSRTFSRKITPVVVGDLAEDVDWRGALQGVDVVVHLAARVHVMRDTASDPLAAFRKVNVEGTRNLARQAAEAGVKRFVFLSSVKVNGESTPLGRAFTTDDVPAPEDAYGMSKLETEQALRELCARTGMEFVVIRPPLVYGPGVRGNFQAMLRAVRRGIPLPLGAVDNRRSLVALDNLVDLIATCLAHPAAANQVFMVSDAEVVSTTVLLRKVAAAYGLPGRLVPVPASWLRFCAASLGKCPAADRLLGSLVVDVSKTRAMLGWTPVVSMDDQLKKMAK
ncbi:SDR family oxidoreductase [Bordetella sp. FB-8]|uniref:UDP-glucose 4-epimerase family protein n=1 Tax=Bordetella sp. FB-8 TaxID=1159870 RepID=UPI0003668383|nr:SDR family oxidoreductase [Bordetella sp. FB-8]